MSKTDLRLSLTTRMVLLLLVAVAALSEPILAVVFFIPIAGWFIWRDHDRMKELEKRLAALESAPQPKPEETHPVPS